MLKQLILLLSIVIVSYNIYGQNIKHNKKRRKIENKEISISNEQSEYEVLFEKEFEELTQKDWQHMFDIIPEDLPKWFFSYPTNTNTTYYAIGISDPGMEEEQAIQQASIRAKAIIALTQNCEFKNITDDYTNLRESQKYSEYSTKFQDYAKADAKLNFNTKKTEILNKFFTKYNEAIVLLKAQSGNRKKNLNTTSVISEHLQIFIEDEIGIQKIEFYNLNIDELYKKSNSTNNLTYNYKTINTDFEINSKWNNVSIKLPDRSYNYQNIINDTIAIDSLNIISNRCNKGLWNSYLSTLLSNMTLKSKKFSAGIKNSNDNYNTNNQGLVRTISKNELIFDINKTQIKDNYLLHDISSKKNRKTINK
ncbi:MAG: hypothetical protein U9R54_01370 [Bacteroidota bacterium]|nr:hypothetical protein [Bacteroidota bacterium]